MSGLAGIAAREVGLKAVWLVPAADRMAGHVIALEYDPACNEGKTFRLLFDGHAAAERCFYRLPPDAVRLYPSQPVDR